MSQTLETPDERLNDLVDEIAALTGEDYVTAMCQALKERRDRLVSPRSGRVIRLSLEVPAELFDPDGAIRDRDA